MLTRKRTYLLSAWLILSVASISAQSGGNYTITQSVVTGGGGPGGGGTIAFNGTAGQPAAGASSSGGGFSVRGGFWAPVSLSPTAASVSISGKVSTAAGNGIRNAQITLTAPNGTTRNAVSGSLGYYLFDDVPAGQTYIVSISSKRFTFALPSIVIDAGADFDGADFVANPLE
jgi:hypothetical protein